MVGEDLHLRLEADHVGWLGFGFGEPTSGHMKGSDMVTVAVVDSDVRVQDRHAIFAGTDDSYYWFPTLTALEDDHNDWSIVWGYEEAGSTHIYVTRALNTTDTQDRAVGVGPVRIIWSWGASDTVAYHGSNRGANRITFVPDATNAARSTLPAYDGSYTFQFANYTIPTRTTTYACQGFTFPVSGADKHVVAIRPLMNNVTTRFNHHAILHVCNDNAFFEEHLVPKPCSASAGDQGQSPIGETDSGCSSLMWSWAMGLDLMVLPDSAGFRIGSSTFAASHVILEVHYDNPALESGLVDDFGFEAYYVDTLREHDAAGMTLGDPTLRLNIESSSSLFGGFLGGLVSSLLWPYDSGKLKAGGAAIHRQATCPGSCTSSLSQPITVFGSSLHAHTAGQKLYTEHYDTQGNYLGIPSQMRIDFWDNGFQAMEELPDGDFVITPGDSLQLHCYFDATQRTEDVEFGYRTQDEMCMQFIYYYPAQTRGVDSAGNPLRFANCGMFAVTSEMVPGTVCGGLSQAGIDVSDAADLINTDLTNLPDFFLVGGQSDRGDDHYADPLRFGESPDASLLGASTSASAQRCYPNGAPPSPPVAVLSPPPPPPPPPPLLSKATMTFTVAGEVGDYSRLQIAARVADTLSGIAPENIIVTFASGSVIVTVEVLVPAGQTVDAVSSSLSATFRSPTSTESALFLAAGTVVATPEIETQAGAVEAAPPASGESDSNGSDDSSETSAQEDSTAYMLALSIGVVLIIVIITALVVSELRERRKRASRRDAELKLEKRAPLGPDSTIKSHADFGMSAPPSPPGPSPPQSPKAHFAPRPLNHATEMTVLDIREPGTASRA